jgi:hypothetical protein
MSLWCAVLIDRNGSTLMTIPDGALSAELIDQAVDLAIELGSCQTLTVIVSLGDAKSDVFGSRWKKVAKTKMRLTIRRPHPAETEDTSGNNHRPQRRKRRV